MRHIAWTAALLILLSACESYPSPSPTLWRASPMPTRTPTATLTVEPSPTALPPTPSPRAPTSTPSPAMGTVKNDVNVRELPSMSARILGQFRKDTAVVLLGRNENSTWFNVPYPNSDSGKAGWVLASAISPSVSTQALAVALQITRTPTITVGSPVATATLSPTAAMTITPKATSTPSTTVTPPAGRITFDFWSGAGYEIHSIGTDGTGERVLFSGATETALGPGGRLIAYRASIGRAPCLNLAVSNLDGGNCTSITRDTTAGYPTWSPDGRTIAYHSRPNSGPARIWRVDSTCCSDPALIAYGTRPAWQPTSGQYIAFDGCKPDGSGCNSIYLVPAFGGDPASAVLVTHGFAPAWSPDGQRLAFQDNDREANLNLFVVSRDGSGRRQVTSNKGNNGAAAWSADGQWLFYRSDGGGTAWTIRAIRVDGTGDRVVTAAPVSASGWDFERLSVTR